ATLRLGCERTRNISGESGERARRSPVPSLEPVQRRLKSLCEIYPGAPAEMLLGLLDVEHRHLEFARAPGRELDVRVPSAEARELLRNAEDGCALARSDVEGAGVDVAGLRNLLALRGSENGGRDVAHIHVVAQLFAVTEDGQRLAFEQAPDEDRDDAGFALRILPRPVHVA